MAYAGNKALIPLGDFGLFTDVPPGDVPRGALILARNVSFETGLITKAQEIFVIILMPSPQELSHFSTGGLIP